MLRILSAALHQRGHKAHKGDGPSLISGEREQIGPTRFKNLVETTLPS